MLGYKAAKAAVAAKEKTREISIRADSRSEETKEEVPPLKMNRSSTSFATTIPEAAPLLSSPLVVAFTLSSPTLSFPAPTVPTTVATSSARL